MQELIARAEKIAGLLKQRRETIVVAESSTGGLISAALLALPGASSYFLGGAVVYTQTARRALLDLADRPLGVEALAEDDRVESCRARPPVVRVALEDGPVAVVAFRHVVGPGGRRRDRVHGAAVDDRRVGRHGAVVGQGEALEEVG